MNINIFDIDRACKEALEAAIDEETGEIVNEDALEAFYALDMQKSEIINNLIRYIKNEKFFGEDCKKIKEEMESKIASSNRKINSLKEILQTVLHGEKFKSANGSVYYKDTVSTNVPRDAEELKKLPEKFVRWKPEANVTEIKEALLRGEEVEGCSLKQNRSVIVR